MNSVQLIGRLTHEPDPGHTPSGTPVTTFRLAVDRGGRDGADFVTVKTWERLAEASAEHLTRGRRVAVQGRLAHEEWTGSDGRRAERLTVVANRVEFLDSPAARGGAAVEDDAANEAATASHEGSPPSTPSRRGGPPRAA
jgi:single-strand DNA-binding protein